jgi:hypothetical protein
MILADLVSPRRVVDRLRFTSGVHQLVLAQDCQVLRQCRLAEGQS